MMGWDEIAGIYEAILDDLGGIELISTEDLENHALNILTYGGIKSDLLDRVRLGKFAFMRRPDFSGEALLLELAYTFSSRIGGSDALPKGIRPYLGDGSLEHCAIKDGLLKKEATPAFLLAWSRLNIYYGAVLASRAAALEARQTEALEGRKTGIQIQQRWYAHWHAAALKRSSDAVPGHTMAELCLEIKKGKLAPAPPYPKDWYERILERKKNQQDPPDVSTGFSRLAPERLQQLRDDLRVPPAVLPPLTREGFMK